MTPNQLSLHINYWVREILLPTFWRGERWRARIEAWLYPVKQLNERVMADREAAITELLTNGQVIYLNKIMNDRFDPAYRRIYVTNDLTTPGRFKVMIPVVLGLVPPSPVLDQLNALVRKYTIAGNSHIIEQYI